MFVKSAIIMSNFFYLKWRHVAFVAFFVELVSFTGLNFRLITPFIGWTDDNGYIYEIIGEIIIKEYHTVLDCRFTGNRFSYIYSIIIFLGNMGGGSIFN